MGNCARSRSTGSVHSRHFVCASISQQFLCVTVVFLCCLVRDVVDDVPAVWSKYAFAGYIMQPQREMRIAFIAYICRDIYTTFFFRDIPSLVALHQISHLFHVQYKYLYLSIYSTQYKKGSSTNSQLMHICTCYVCRYRAPLTKPDPLLLIFSFPIFPRRQLLSAAAGPHTDLTFARLEPNQFNRFPTSCALLLLLLLLLLLIFNCTWPSDFTFLYSTLHSTTYNILAYLLLLLLYSIYIPTFLLL